jgi:tetratricopeptide (TPR) repeat protein
MAKQGRHEEEYDLYKTIAGTAGVSKRILSNAYCNLGTMQESNIPMEIEYYRKALENDPSNVAALQSMGSAYASLKDWKIAVDHYRRSAELDRDNYEVLTLLYRAAAQQLRTETKSSPQSREAMMERLGEIMGISNMNRLLTLKN